MFKVVKTNEIVKATEFFPNGNVEELEKSSGKSTGIVKCNILGTTKNVSRDMNTPGISDSFPHNFPRNLREDKLKLFPRKSVEPKFGHWVHYRS